MKKIFKDDQSYIEIEANKDKVVITLCARDAPDSMDVTMVSVEMDKTELKEMVNKL